MAGKKRRSAAQRRATAKLVAMNRARRSGSARKSPKRRASRRRASARRASPRVTVVRVGNPTRRSRKRRSASRRRAAPVVMARRRSRRRNPSMRLGSVTSIVRNQLMPSTIGAAGALGLDVLMGVLPLPDAVKTGPLRPVARIGGAIALGFLASFAGMRKHAAQITVGAMTVVLYDVMKGFAARVAGGKIPGIGVYEIPGVGMYEVSTPSGGEAAIGYTDSGQQVGEYVSGFDAEGVYR